jgi:hypothetical protein
LIGCRLILLELKWYRTLNFIQNPPSFDLTDDGAEICARLLDTVKTSKCSGYQIVIRRIRKNSSHYQPYVRVDVVEWFNSEKGKGQVIEEQADYYIKQVENESEHNGVSSNSNSQKNSYKDLEDLWSCNKMVPVDGHWQPCKFYVKELFYVYGNGEFYAAARCDGLPIITICPIKHCTNEEWVRTPKAWKAIFEVLEFIEKELQLNELSFYEIYANFGIWHSQIRKGSSSGHAHINIVLTSEVIEAIKARKG